MPVQTTAPLSLKMSFHFSPRQASLGVCVSSKCLSSPAWLSRQESGPHVSAGPIPSLSSRMLGCDLGSNDLR